MKKVSLKILKSGYCTGNKNKTLAGAESVKQRFYALFALIEHSDIGKILFDTGYSKHFFEASKKFPYNLYAKLTPVTLEDEPDLPCDIKYVIISHFHADHISGLKKFNNAKFICSKHAFEAIKNKRGMSAVSKGFLPDLLPLDFEKRLLFIEDISNKVELSPFDCAYDVFNDDSIIAVNLEGHATGQTGILVDSFEGKKFLISDACWNSESYMKNITPPDYVLNFLGNKKQYVTTLDKIHRFYKENSDVEIIPSHCPIFWSKKNG